MSGHDIIVIGASAGGVEALRTLAQALPAHFPASVFVVLHIPAYKPSLLPALLSHAGSLRAFHPLDQALIERERIYVAPPDCHLLVAFLCILSERVCFGFGDQRIGMTVNEFPGIAFYDNPVL
ncbi:MAG TPA: chemotaxis protein CheB [Ktedonobacteraceae bacterium]